MDNNISCVFSEPFFIAVSVTALCFFLFLFSFLRSSSSLFLNNKHCNCACSCNGVVSNSDSSSLPYLNGGTAVEMLELSPAPVVLSERRTGSSMMEELVPEIKTHALSYLDFPSLCRLSMTNSLMRKAANDDNAWKALYHKDYTLEQDCVTPTNGWKAYYAATRAIVNVNTEFFNIVRNKSIPAMSHFWLNADYVKCIHASGDLFSGYNAVLQSWQLVFNWGQGLNFEVWDVRARVLTDMAWITMKTYVDMDTGPFNTTNIFEFHNGRWYMVHHHSSVMNGEMEQQHVHG
ncbi:putative F-box domain, NTF2-like domain-containing protein [Lupinus albus]|uniref:Putative F-box domain, NTF2-like domain-containing protein n=1 Tax=Lupinus albus TaxID=3870 RepID=A0A6A4QK30_LUPAL|nr:putative F-box domain, NTF2-like domain-containing protein [Lupinus albus]